MPAPMPSIPFAKQSSVALTAKEREELMMPKSVSLESPIELTEAEKLYFDMIVSSRAPEIWTKYALLMGAQLAKAHARFDDYDAQCMSEPFLIYDEDGKTKRNPVYDVLDRMQQRILTMSKVCGVAVARADPHPGSYTDKRTTTQRIMEAAVDRAEADPFL